MLKPFTTVIAALILWLSGTLAALGACAGDDLRYDLTPTETAALAKAMEGKPYPSGNHWRATRGGDVLHLIGTMHLDDPRFDPIESRLTPLIETADALLLEMTDTEEAALQSSLQSDPSLLILEGASLPDLMGEDDWALLAEAMRARSMPPFMVAKFQPWYVSMLLSMPACLDLAAADAGGLDSRFEEIANEAGVPTQALEPFETGFRAFDAVSMDTQIAMVRAALTAPEAGEDLFATMLAAYFDEENAASWELSMVLAPRLSSLTDAENEEIFSTMNRLLLVDRNRAWIPVILDALQDADSHVIAAFGAAHLAGEDGVLNLLAQEGFELERLPF